MTDLAGRIALVTGGATGIGAGISRSLASAGASVAIGQPDSDQAELFASQLVTAGYRACGVAIDVRSPMMIRGAFDEVAERLGDVDILINNAAITGTPAISLFLETTEEHLDLVIDVNLKGPFRCAQEAARRMTRGGVIIMISSVGAFAGQEGATAYCAAKSGLSGLIQAMSLELAPLGIRVLGVAPGDIATEASAHIREDVQASGATGRFLRTTPLGRQGTPQEIGRVVTFLASADASFLTGTTIVADGGFLAY